MYTERRKTNRTLTEWLNVFISIFREITVLNQRLEHRKHSVLHPALIIYREAHTNVAYTNFTTTLVTVTLHTVIWSPNLVQRGHWWCLGLTYTVSCPLSEDSLQVQRPSERKRPQLEFLPLKSGTNEFPSRSFHPLASNVHLPNLWYRLQGLPPWQLQRLQHLWLQWIWQVYESRTRQHPRAYGHAPDSAFLAGS